MTQTLLTLRLDAMRREADGVLSLELARPDGSPLPPAEAGAHIDLHLPNGLVRSYSLITPRCTPRAYVVAALLDRASRGGSLYIHQQLRVGAELPVSPPRNHFRLEENVGQTVLIAGGIGITPIYSMYARMRALERPVSLLYCARAREQAALADDIARGGLPIDWHIDAEAGCPPKLADYLRRFPADSHFYCCGPTAMLDSFEQSCAELGLHNVHVERFAAKPAAPAADAARAPYEVVLAKSGRKLSVASGQSLHDALQANGVKVDYSCKEGICGACETRVLDGEPDHRDSVLSPAERQAGKTMMVCVSGCKSRQLVLDL
ncbi:PDR/VanB family oxidoreductase [Chromobacterium haemolyticum]|uniref:PDR/VanB family oxidoreductase n=1 Tax=Chromobacterium haemolyticum TaxID=394935 RepID=UPI00307CEF22